MYAVNFLDGHGEENTILVFDTKEVMNTLDYLDATGCEFLSMTFGNTWLGVDNYKEFLKNTACCGSCTKEKE